MPTSSAIVTNRPATGIRASGISTAPSAEPSVDQTSKRLTVQPGYPQRGNRATISPQ